MKSYGKHFRRWKNAQKTTILWLDVNPRGVNLLQGRVRTLKNHLKKCREYLNAEEEPEFYL
jgi:hypothetical protein